MIKKSLILTVLALLLYINSFAAPFKNVQRIVIQPNGDSLYCFISGDEFYNRLHDANGFTIIQDEKTGYFVYAAQDAKGAMTATSLIAGKSNPAEAGLRPNIMISNEEYLKIRNEREKHIKPLAIAKGRELNKGNYNNLIILIRFAGDAPLGTTASEIDSMFNGSHLDDISMSNYFHSASYNQLNMHSYCFPEPDGEQLLSYEDNYPREYYLPYNAQTNPMGYQDWEHATREFDLLEKAINYVKFMIPDTINIDYNDDGLVDNVVFVVKGNVSDWSSLLWPHRWVLYDRNLYINDKQVWDFNFQLETSDYFSSSTLCHEMSHSLGFPDLYHYNAEGSGLSPVGSWDLMCSNAQPPQHSGIYMKHKYGNWCDDIPEITEYGTYTLEADSWEGNRRNAFKIKTSNPNQFYMIEYRDNKRWFETGLAGSGLLMYRIDTRYTGCASYNGYDEFDEVYIFRPGGSQTVDGAIGAANFNKNLGKTEFNSTTDPYPFLTGGSIDNTFNICNISEVGDKMSFTYCPSNFGIIPQNLIANVIGSSSIVKLTWDAVNEATSYNVYRDGVVIAENVTVTNYDDNYSSVADGYHKYYVTAICGDEESYHSVEQKVITGDYCAVVFNMKDSGNDGWKGGEVKVSFSDNQEDQYFTLYSGSEETRSLVIPTGTIVTLDWLGGWNDSECSLTVNYGSGEEIYSSENLEAGELISFTSTCNSNSCVQPQNLTAALDGTNVILNWTSSVETEQFEVFRDNVSIATVNASNYTDSSISHSGTHFYKVRAKQSGCESDFSNEITATVMNYYCGAPLSLNTNVGLNRIEMNWNAPQNGGLLCYDNGEYQTSIGANNMVWAIKVMPEQLHLFAGSLLSKIEMYDASTGNFTFKVYNGESVNTNTLISTVAQEMTASHAFVTIPLETNVPFDAELPVWVTVQSTGATNPGPCCDYIGNPNSCLIKSGTSWKPITNFNMNYSWLLRVYTTIPPDMNSNLTYNLYRDGEMILNDHETLSYIDNINVTGTYCYKVTANFNGLESDFSNESCQTIGVGIEEQNADKASIYPNPVKDIMTVSCDNMQIIKIINVTGTVVFENLVNENVVTLDLSNMTSGLYIMQIITDSEIITRNISVMTK